jgi:hypothetical protein
MKIIEINTQEELDNLPDAFDEFTIIRLVPKKRTKFVLRVARGNSSVEAWENSSVEARGNSSVEAWGNCVVRFYNQIKKIVLEKFSIGISIGFIAEVDLMAETATLIENPKATYNKEDFLGIYKKNIQTDDKIKLYKSVNPETDSDFFTGKIKYEGVVYPKSWDDNPERQCGAGLHLSPSPKLALSYNPGEIKECLVKFDDFVVYPHDITKVRCRRVEVLDDK